MSAFEAGMQNILMTGEENSRKGKLPEPSWCMWMLIQNLSVELVSQPAVALMIRAFSSSPESARTSWGKNGAERSHILSDFSRKFGSWNGDIFLNMIRLALTRLCSPRKRCFKKRLAVSLMTSLLTQGPALSNLSRNVAPRSAVGARNKSRSRE